ncbi:MAG: AIR synthase family protein [Candidatus Thorarchaeota archaeon]|nr:MAG: AIR synthase family protein [Candidatus Thorarchaeota archaeon]
MLPGKIPPDVLKTLVFSHLGSYDPDIILGPAVGEDASLIQIGENVVVAATDPITGSIEDIGWLAVHINANDIATFGVAPRWFLVSILLPPASSPDDLARIMEQINRASESLGISVAGGHTEITEGIDRPILTGFMMGITSPGGYVTSAGARTGDHIIMTKTAAIEGTAILATEGEEILSARLGKNVVSDACEMRGQISVVKEGVTAFGTGYLTAMHDPTEGGLSGGLHELCDASDVGFRIDLDRIPVHDVTRQVCDMLSIDFMELISSGCMLMTCDPDHSEDVVSALHSVGVLATVIGTIESESKDRTFMSKGEVKPLPRPSTDALWHALNRLSQT